MFENGIFYDFLKILTDKLERNFPEDVFGVVFGNGGKGIQIAFEIKNINTFAKKAGTLKKMLDGFKKVVVTSVGHSTTTSLLENGLTVDYEPENPRMGNLVRETARRFQYLIHKNSTDRRSS